MAKDGTVRGGARMGSGQKKRKPQTENFSAGKPLPDIVQLEPVDLEGLDMPPVKEYMTATQRLGEELCAAEIHRETWMWLKKMGCDHLVTPQLVNQYAMAVARSVQCEQALSEFGLLAKHPTTGNAMKSPYAALLDMFQKEADRAWFQIQQIVKDNYTGDYLGASAMSDPMEMLLRSREGRKT